MYDNGDWVIDICVQHMYGGSACFKKSINNYIWQHDSRNVRTLDNHIVEDVTVQRGTGSSKISSSFTADKVESIKTKEQHLRRRKREKSVINVETTLKLTM